MIDVMLNASLHWCHRPPARFISLSWLGHSGYLRGSSFRAIPYPKASCWFTEFPLVHRNLLLSFGIRQYANQQRQLQTVRHALGELEELMRTTSLGCPEFLSYKYTLLLHARSVAIGQCADDKYHHPLNASAAPTNHADDAGLLCKARPDNPEEVLWRRVEQRIFLRYLHG